MMDTLKVQSEVNGHEAGAPGLTGVEAFLVFEGRLLHTSAAAISLASCHQLETIVVNTRRNVYEIVVRDGKEGDVLVRGGSYFPEFCAARFVGSTSDGRAIKVNTIDLGLRMEFQIGRATVVTSAVTSVVRQDAQATERSLA